jgi:TolB-like protein/DNA-binding winged helix-turn-helix (wHTH) protein
MEETCHLLEFRPFDLELTRCELSRSGLRVAIHATPLRLLIYLIENRERSVSKQELLDRVWPDSYVSEYALTSAISALRQALDDDGTEQRRIRTERGRGYRFISDVEEHVALGSSFPLTCLAVLPFADMSPNGDWKHLAVGLTEQLIHELTQVPRLQIVSRTSAFAVEQRLEDVRLIASELDVGTVVEGSVRTSTNRARVTVQVIRAADGYHLLSQTYDRPLEDVLDLEEEVAREIRAAIEDKLCGRSTRGGHGTPETL